jgi:hypothetical protein
MKFVPIFLLGFCFSLSAAGAGLGFNPFEKGSPTSATNPNGSRPSGPTPSAPQQKPTPTIAPQQVKPDPQSNKINQQNKK